MAAVREDEARLFRAEMDALLQVLTADQVRRFYGLRDDLMQRVRRVRQGAASLPIRARPHGAGRVDGPAALTSPLGLG
jgi:hypothetical protein